MFLELNNVSKSFGSFKAVNDLSFSLEKGEIFGIAGPNGAGKTTLFNTITGFYKGEGEILFKGKNISNMTSNAVCREGIARTFQMPSVFQSMSVSENIRVGIRFGIKGKKSEERILDDVLKFTGLFDRKEEMPDRLTIYEKKLTMLASAIATEPEILLLDEPAAGLSPVEADEFIKMAIKINRERGISIIVIEHLMRVLVSISNRLMILDNGSRIALGDPQDVIKDENVIEIYLGSKGKTNARG